MVYKANKMPDKMGIKPFKPPQRPNAFQLQENGRKFPPNHLHHTWTDYLYWDVELELDEKKTNKKFILINHPQPKYHTL